ncbi:ABC transporter substrate-binding protein [Actinomycetospora sp. OC33-EN08]|uniref:ABC transporter substrate-binding protein n=1 Tax=Actinomycetospora aurantiaca TaxID=3129233 RepID=A0ABU8MM97_9PSEU
MISRRTFLGGAAAASTAIALAGCSTDAGSSGRVRVAFPGGGSRETLDPHVVPQFLDQARAKACFEVLAGWGQDMRPEPRLAESWESDPTATRWNIRLRRTTWHDGRPVTAADVLATWRRIADPATSASAATLYRGVDLAASSAVSDTELDVVLTAPNRFFPLAWGAPGAEILPGGTVDPSRPVGCGPFRFASFLPGVSTLYTAFDGHWAGPPASRELEFLVIGDETARVGALLSGQVAWAHDLRTTSAAQVDGDSRTRLVAAPAATHYSLPLRVDRPPFSDPRLREAVRLGIDREALVRVAMLGRGRPGNDMFGRDVEYYPADVPQVTRDVDRARALVAEAGAQGLAFDLQASTVAPVFPGLATQLAEQLGEIGLRATPRMLPSENYFVSIRTTGVASLSQTGSLPIPDFLARRAVSTAVANNYTGYRNPAIDQLVAAAAAAPDPSAPLRDAQLLLRADSGNLFPVSGDYLVGTAAELTGYDPARPNTAAWARFDQVRVD